MSSKNKAIIVICVILLILALFESFSITIQDRLTNGDDPSAPAIFKLAGLNTVIGVLFLVMGRCVPNEKKKAHCFLIGFGIWNALGGILGVVIAATMH
jgi:hypothetical protein